METIVCSSKYTRLLFDSLMPNVTVIDYSIGRKFFLLDHLDVVGQEGLLFSLKVAVVSVNNQLSISKLKLEIIY